MASTRAAQPRGGREEAAPGARQPGRHQRGRDARATRRRARGVGVQRTDAVGAPASTGRGRGRDGAAAPLAARQRRPSGRGRRPGSVHATHATHATDTAVLSAPDGVAPVGARDATGVDSLHASGRPAAPDAHHRAPRAAERTRTAALHHAPPAAGSSSRRDPAALRPRPSRLRPARAGAPRVDPTASVAARQRTSGRPTGRRGAPAPARSAAPHAGSPAVRPLPHARTRAERATAPRSGARRGPRA